MTIVDIIHNSAFQSPFKISLCNNNINRAEKMKSHENLMRKQAVSYLFPQMPLRMRKIESELHILRSSMVSPTNPTQGTFPTKFSS